MKGKKVKTGLKKTKKRAPKENVQASTSLPPEVEGQLRCYLRVSVTKIIWTVSNPPDIFHVRLRWWGEVTNGTIYRPFDVKNQKKSTVRSIARFPIRCGPKQFATYLNDMGTVVFEVLRGQSMAPMGKVQINEIGHLTPTRPINGFFTVFSNKNAEKIAELQISLVFEPLPASYESSSSVPTTDVSMMPREGSRPDEVTSVSKRKDVPKPEPMSYHYSASSDDPFTSPKLKPKLAEMRPGSRVPTPQGIDSDYSFVIGPGYVAGHTSKDTVSDVSKIETKFDQYKSQQKKALEPQVESEVSKDTPVKPQVLSIHPSSEAGADIISSLLNRGTRLRNDMIQAELNTWNGQANFTSKTQQVPSGIIRPQSGELLHEILKTESADKRQQTGMKCQEILNLDPYKVKDLNSHAVNDMKTRMVELVLGDKLPHEKLKKLQQFQDGVDAVSLSSDSDVISDLEDPIHDDALLHQLFYKHSSSSSSVSLSDLSSSDDEQQTHSSNNRSISIDDPGNIRPPSRKSSRLSSRRESCSSQPCNENVAGVKVNDVEDDGGDKDEDAKSLSARSEGSRVSFDDIVHEENTDKEGLKVVEGLSIERLTLLGRVNIARVSIDHMTLEDLASAQPSVSTKTLKGNKLKSRPPRPVQKPKRKRTYLVEYKFPVVATSRDGGSKVTTATEVMRFVSKKVQEADVSFTHRSVFPIRFDETAVNRWWKHLLVFKIFVRTAGQKTPDLLGVASVSLRSVLQSSNLSIQVEVPVKDKKDKSKWSGSDEKLDDHDDKTVARLQVSVELASDSKDFLHDLAKVQVSEMKGSQLLPIPSHKPATQVIKTFPDEPHVKIQKEKNKEQQTSALKMHNSPGGQSSAGQSSVGHSSVDHSLVGHSSVSRIPVPIRRVSKRVVQQPVDKQQQEILVEEMNHGVAQHHQTPMEPEPELITLYCLLHIPNGSGLNLEGVAPPNMDDKKPQPHPSPHPGRAVGITGFGRDNITRNTYIVCRMFWCDEFVNSNICWGTTEPNYELLQIVPVLLTPSLLERAKNNFMIIEVWDKKTSAENDELVGIVKVSLHQFYMSFRDPRISKAMLKSKFPVVAVDNCLPVVNPFTGYKYGHLKVLLSLGSQEQISEIQRIKLDMKPSIPIPDRPEQFLERADGLQAKDVAADDQLIEHTFEVIVEGIRGFPQFQDTIWGEADCFVQYHFPSLAHDDQHVTNQPIKHAPPTLKAHRTATTLCIPEPMFHDICRHRLNIPSSTPVQRELLTACAGVGGGAGGIPFEVWCRYYCPNIRDQVLAKATLPLAKLCAMVTMQKRGETSVQSFSLPLRPQLDDDEGNDTEKRAKLHDAGLLDITINYKTSVIKAQRQHGLNKPVGSQVCIAVGILRACGLKAAAKSVARHDAGMQYPSDVGVNSYVKAVMSFLSKDEIRVTQTVARNFAPEFAHYVDFPCPLWFSEDSEVGGISLAEVLETADITCQVWHQVPGFKPDLDVKVLDAGSVGRSVTARRLFASSGDILLGSCTIPLQRLLTSKTGIKGWYPLYIPPLGWDNASEAIQPIQPQDQKASQATTYGSTDRVVGGIEVLINLAHQHDRERVIHAARSLGWAPDDSLQDIEDWHKQDDHVVMTSQVDVHVDIAVLPVSCALRAGQTNIDKQAKAYIRYKFYDKAAVLSSLCYLDDEDGEYIKADLQHAHRFRCHSTEPFIWYLKEERLEIQLWISFSDTTGSEIRPRQRDKLIGCAYFDLSPLTKKFRDTQRISGMYPLFKPGATYLGGAFLRVHISRKEMRQHREDNMDGEGSIPDVDDDINVKERQRMMKQMMEKKKEEEEEQKRQSEEAERLRKTEEEKRKKEEEEKWKRRPVRVHVVIEQAMHISCNIGGDGVNTFYVSYQTTDGAVSSPSESGNDRINWGFEHESKLNRDVLENQNLIFKIWQQTSKDPSTASDRVLGFVSVDLCPLLAGFKLINGWYNIMDFSGQCQGQLKIAISPLESISPLKQPIILPQQSSTTSPKPKTTSFTASSQYSDFPSHLVQYPEQTIQYHDPTVESDNKQHHPTHEASHFEDHLRNVRHFHETLQQKLSDLSAREMGSSERNIQLAPNLGLFGSDTSSSFMMNSKSFLRRNLRENLQQLDIIQENLRKKLERRDYIHGRDHTLRTHHDQRKHSHDFRTDHIERKQNQEKYDHNVNHDQRDHNQHRNHFYKDEHDQIQVHAQERGYDQRRDHIEENYDDQRHHRTRDHDHRKNHKHTRDHVERLDHIEENNYQKHHHDDKEDHAHKRDHDKFMATSSDLQFNGYNAESEEPGYHIANDYPRDKLMDNYEKFGRESPVHSLEGRPVRSLVDDIISDDELRTKHLNDDVDVGSPTSYQVADGEFTDVEGFSEFPKDPLRTFEKDLLDTPPSEVQYETMENIEDLLPVRPPPDHFNPPQQESDSDWDKGSDVEEVIPRPLNDISSPEFSNGIIPNKATDIQFNLEGEDMTRNDSNGQVVDVRRKLDDAFKNQVKSKEDLVTNSQVLDRDSSFIVLSTDTRSQQELMHAGTLQADNKQSDEQSQNYVSEQEVSEENTKGNKVDEEGRNHSPEGSTKCHRVEESTSDHSVEGITKDHISKECTMDHKTVEAVGVQNLHQDGEVNVGNSDDDSVVITINPKEAITQKERFEKQLELEEKEKPSQPPVAVPNFFLPPDDLEASMRALRTAASVLPPRHQSTDQQTAQKRDRQFSASRAAAVKEVADRLHKPKVQMEPRRPKTQNRPPTAEEAKRIARIFAAKYSTS